MTTLAELEAGCGMTLGHGESCSTNYLCNGCAARIKSYIFRTNLTSAVIVLRSQERLWKRTTHRRVLKLQDALDALCSFIEDEA